MTRQLRDLAEREQVHFRSGGTTCAALHYRGDNGACLIMAAGGGVPKEPGTGPFAERFHAAGYSVLAFDYRRQGESGGQPRQIIRIREQHADWQAAIAFAATLPEVDAAKLVIWGYSLSGGHVLAVAARNPQLAAAIAHAPLADGVAASSHAMRYQKPIAAIRLTGRGLFDAIGGLFGREPLLVPLAGKPGTVAMLTTPDALDADRAFSSADHSTDWPKHIAARSALRIGCYRPGRQARRIQCPLLVIAHDDDCSALPKPGVRAAQHAANGSAVQLPGGHYGGYLDSHDRAVAIQLSFVAHHIGRPAFDGPSWF